MKCEGRQKEEEIESVSVVHAAITEVDRTAGFVHLGPRSSAEAEAMHTCNNLGDTAADKSCATIVNKSTSKFTSWRQVGVSVTDCQTVLP